MSTKFREDKLLKLLQKLVEDRLGIDLMKNTRRTNYVYARALFYGLAYNTNAYSYASIGNYVGKDHATVLHSIKKVLPHVLQNEFHW